MQMHNVCSGKHCGFLAHAQHLKAGPEYIDVDHPVQRAVRATLEELTGVVSPGHAPDGCSAPNFATTISGLAMALGQYAGAAGKGDARSRAMTRLAGAMMAHPELVHGTGDFDTDMMRALPGQVALKRGAEGCQSAILPQRGLGIALKCADGAKRGAEAAMTAILVALGVIEADHPVARAWSHKPIVNCRGAVVGHGRPVAGWPGPIS